MNEHEKKVHTHLKTVLDGLKVLLENEHLIDQGKLPDCISPKDFEFNQGICWYTSMITRDVYTKLGGQLIHAIPERWQLFSGCLAYPVPSTDRHLTHKDMYRLTLDRNMWSNHSRYGNYRWSLVKFYIKSLEEIITEDSILPLDYLETVV